MKKRNKRKLLISLASAALLAAGTAAITSGGNTATFSLQTVQAAKKARTVKLTKNTYVYNRKGKRKGKKALKKGHSYKAYSTKKIKGKKYYHIGKGRYVKVANFKKKAASVTPSAGNGVYGIVLTKNSYIYDKNGQRVGTSLLKKGTSEIAYGTISINGKSYYAIGSGHYIRTVNAKEGSGQSTSTPTNSGSQEAIKPSEKPNKENSSDKTKSPDGKPVASNGGDPNQAQIERQLKEGYVYFTKDQVKQIRDLLWQKIQNYRVEQDYQPYKSNVELDNFVNTAASTSSGFAPYQWAVNSQDADNLASYLPTLKEQGMDSMRGIDSPDYYGNTYGNYPFDISDHDVDSVANSIFKSFVDTPRNNEIIKGNKDKNAFGSLALNYHYNGDYSCLGLLFIEVTGNNPKWISYYNAN